MIRSEDSRNDSSEQLFPMLASEVARNSSRSQSSASETSKSGEERISIFWRVFGGTILSIAALVVITAYQSISNSIQDLRNQLSHANEARAELVKKDEYSANRTKMWDRMQEMQKETQQLTTPVSQMQQRIDKLELENRALVAERRDIHELHATIKERLTQFEQQLSSGKAMQKDLALAQQSISALLEKTTLRDQQMKQIDDDRKEMGKEIQQLRERLAKMEAAKEVKASVTKPTSSVRTKPMPVEPPDDQ